MGGFCSYQSYNVGDIKFIVNRISILLDSIGALKNLDGFDNSNK